MTDIRTIFDAVQGKLEADLRASLVSDHPGERGAGAEASWIQLLRDHLPNRYQVGRGFVVDTSGAQSREIDLVIYDRQYTPVLFTREDRRFVPAESVYAVFEIKQTLDRRTVEDAGEKIASVRRLKRTSAPVVHAGGVHSPREPFRITGGVLASRFDWSPPLGSSLHRALGALDDESRIDLGCGIQAGAFTAWTDKEGHPSLSVTPPPHAVLAFFFDLIQRLQKLGTVPAIDYEHYARLVPGGWELLTLDRRGPS